MSEIKKSAISEQLMRSMGIKQKIEKNQIVIYVPSDLEHKLKEQFNFSFGMLKVGADLQLGELAVHLDEQATMEAYVGTLVEKARYEFSLAQDAFDIWYAELFYKTKVKLQDSTGGVTEKLVHGRIINKYKKEYEQKKQLVSKLEYTYRLLSNAIHASIITKGKMMQSLRNVLQAGGDGFAGVDVKPQREGKLVISKKGKS